MHKSEVVGVLILGEDVRAIGNGLFAAVVPAQQRALGAAAADQPAGVDAVFDDQVGVQGVAHDAAEVVVGVHVRCHDAVRDPVGQLVLILVLVALHEAHKSRGVIFAPDAAGDVQILDGGAVDVAEGGRALVIGVGDADGEGVAAAVEDAGEGVFLPSAGDRAGLLEDGDIGPQLDVFPGVGMSRRDGPAEADPVRAVADHPGIRLGAGAREVGDHGEGHRHRAGITARAGDGQLIEALGRDAGHVLAVDGEGVVRAGRQRLAVEADLGLDRNELARVRIAGLNAAHLRGAADPDRGAADRGGGGQAVRRLRQGGPEAGRIRGDRLGGVVDVFAAQIAVADGDGVKGAGARIAAAEQTVREGQAV